MTSVAFIGMGAMGRRMARRVLDSGHTIVVWNRSPGKAAELIEAGAVHADSPAGAARAAEVVVTMVADPSALQAVTEGSDGIAAGIRADATVMEMSTVGPAAVKRLAAVLPAGAGLLDSPVLGSLSEAESGTLRLFVGGPPDLVARWASFLTTFGEPTHVGALGSGAAAKLVANAVLFGVLGVLGEALALAHGLGLSTEAAFEVLAATPLSTQAERRRPALDTGDFPTRFALSLARKDADLLLRAAGDAGVDVRLLRAAQTWLADAEGSGLGAADYSSVLSRIVPARRTSPDEPVDDLLGVSVGREHRVEDVPHEAAFDDQRQPPQQGHA